ncbi:glycine-rich domain-containing protein [Hymenobacter elongatus]|uniref:Uncharacterized protein n=1 Tax=Hymenobacter elongatus TaxID=877208 RepID=A0A4Z0PGR9_9BACT|nr:hypothetical protein [Hymenobacter elongatus]TGE12411.1 hypothetical protein E5J99_20255 [Hymenobacter elongatus]
MEKYSISEEEAEKIFMDVKIWLWLNVKANYDGFKGLAVNDDLFILDEMWHSFILFTHEYTQYCISRFGIYMHHRPTTKAEKDAFRQVLLTDKAEALRTKTESQDQQYEYVLDILGTEVLERWYLYYPNTYHRGVREDLRLKA